MLERKFRTLARVAGALGLIAIGALTLAPAPTIAEAEISAQAAPARAVNPPLGRMVWMHMMGQMPRNAGMQYGSTYPISIFDEKDPVARAGSEKQFIYDVIHSGIGGIAFEILPGKGGNAIRVPQYAALVKAMAGSGILVAPCFDSGKSPEDLIDAIEQSYQVAKNYGNPALMADGRLIVFFYGSRSMAPDDWARVRSKVIADGFPVFMIGDASQANIPPANAFANAAALAAHWDGAYNFPGAGVAGAADSNANWNKVMAANHKVWVGSIMPSYYRGIAVNPSYGPFGVDAQGTGRLRSLWSDILQSNIGWVYWITQNDFVEHTNLAPDSSWGYTRSDMNLWFSRLLTKGSYPFGQALYLTAPQSLRAGERSVAELAIINPDATPVKAHLQVVADNGDVLGAADLTARAHQLDAVQIPLVAPAGGRYAFARAVAKGPSGTITSAPILFSTESKLPRDHGVTNYYSLNSRLTTPKGWRPVISAQGNNVRISGIDARSVLSADLLADGNLIDQIKFPPAGDIGLSKTRVLQVGRDSDDNKNSRLYGGPRMYLVRIVLKNGAMWFSDPMPDAPKRPS
ncbi:hypothetical protein FHW96_001761 [Novosphingobium sp. SG751A]|uniref:hypothetical protein n=1 Tax=Novosphingobium sp. SG751A TaxID=2587000 RepID=UPI001556AA2F|nr:hypothetical protein [Novosphingobium sp. SG751A]NOW45606.1 hypothetical protein [Novosphingobium sp. SG751A]